MHSVTSAHQARRSLNPTRPLVTTIDRQRPLVLTQVWHTGRRMLRAAMVADHVVLGGGNVKKLLRLPPRSKRGDNRNAFRGGMRVWG